MIEPQLGLGSISYKYHVLTHSNYAGDSRQEHVVASFYILGR